MKRYILIIIFVIILIPTICNAMDFYVFGVNLKWLKEAEPKDYCSLILGGISNYAVHELGHIGYCKYKHIDYEFVSLTNWKVNSNNKQYISNASKSGYILDSIIGIILTSLKSTRNSYFTKGYTSANTFGLMTYDIRNKNMNDFNTIKENGGNADLFKLEISAISLHNMLRQEW